MALGHMNAEESLRELEASLARPSATPCTWRADRDAYLAEMAANLRSHLISPMKVKAVASEWAQRYADQSSEVREMMALVRSEDTWLLYDPKQKVFAKAFGNNLEAPLSLLGFSSDDALTEWLG